MHDAPQLAVNSLEPNGLGAYVVRWIRFLVRRRRALRERHVPPQGCGAECSMARDEPNGELTRPVEILLRLSSHQSGAIYPAVLNRAQQAHARKQQSVKAIDFNCHVGNLTEANLGIDPSTGGTKKNGSTGMRIRRSAPRSVQRSTDLSGRA